MARKTKSKKFTANEGAWAAETPVEVSIPDEAVYYIVSNYLSGQTTTGLSIVTGVSTKTVEDILQLLVDWAAKGGHIKDGVMQVGVTQ